ncbi:MAG TPA: phosphodiester glycosidase family protein [Aestuariivirga sp.]|nr:phosphodiester glycosidase family protein [Aestuariivirga sp.]
MRRFFPIVLFLCLQSVWVAAGPLCSPLSYGGNAFSVCRIDLRETRLELFNLDDQGAPLGSFTALAEDLRLEGKELAFAMNAGMFDEGLKPIGLYVENGTQAKKLNRRDGYGNFHVKPNGVFYIMGDRVGVAATDAYVKLNEKPDFATQSGPMLVIDGKIHPKFSPGGMSYKMRNGVGVLDAHTAIFVISENAVNFHEFALLFRDGLKCANALFFDGTVSSLYSPELGRNDGFAALGPMVGAVKVK